MQLEAWLSLLVQMTSKLEMNSFVTSSGAYDLSAIMRAAHAECWTFRTTARQVGPRATDLEFIVVRVYDRRRLAVALRAVWRRTRRQQMTWRINQPEALARAASAEALIKARHATEHCAICAEMAEHPQADLLPLPLAA